MYIQQVVNATIETDIPQYADLTVSTARKLKRLLAIIAQSAPFKPNMSQIGGQLEVLEQCCRPLRLLGESRTYWAAPYFNWWYSRTRKGR